MQDKHIEKTVLAIAIASFVCFCLFVGLVLTSPAHAEELDEHPTPAPIIQTVYVDRVITNTVYVDKPVEKIVYVDKVVEKIVYETSTVTVENPLNPAYKKAYLTMRAKYLKLAKAYKALRKVKK